MALKSRTRKLALGLVAGLLLSAQAGLAQPVPVSLSEAVDAAWRRSAQSAEVAGQVRRAQAERTAASALWPAAPAAEIGQMRERQRGNGRSRETELGLALPLWLPGQRSARLEAAQAEGDAASAASGAGRLRVAALVLDAAWEIALQRAEVAAAEAQARELDALARDVDRRVAAGDLARADSLAAGAERLAAAAGVKQATQRLQAARIQWTALTGLTAAPELAAPAEGPAAGVLDSHPALRWATLNVALARKRLDVLRASKRESPELVARVRQEVAGSEPATHGVGLAIRVPFGTADRNEPLWAAALSELEVAEATERELRQQLEAGLAAARSAQESARQQVLDENARARLLRERAVLIEKSFQAGETALPDMLRALTAATQAEAALLRQQAVLGQASARLQQALGIVP